MAMTSTAGARKGVFNFEGGCYAKAINLNSQGRAGDLRGQSNQFGALLENVILDPVTGEPDYTDVSLTENTRSLLPHRLHPRPRQIRSRRQPARGDHAHRRRLRRAAPVWPSSPRTRPCTTSCPATPPRSPEQSAGWAVSRRRRSRPASARRSCPVTPASTQQLLRREGRGDRRGVLVGQHRLDGRHVRCRQPHPAGMRRAR